MTVDRSVSPDIETLSERSREIFREIVESYLQTGSPVGSRTLSQRLQGRLSPASVRNVMSDLEAAGLLSAPHTSAGRLPTEAGLRMPLAEVAFAAGFNSVRRFNDAFRATYSRPPSSFRRKRRQTASGKTDRATEVSRPYVRAPANDVPDLPPAPD